MKFLSVLVLAALATACSHVEKTDQVSQNTAAVEDVAERYPARTIGEYEVPLSVMEISKKSIVPMSIEAIEDGYTQLRIQARNECIEKEKNFKENGIFSDLTVTSVQTSSWLEQKAVENDSVEAGVFRGPMYKNQKGNYDVFIESDNMTTKMVSVSEAEKLGYQAELSLDAMCTTFKNTDPNIIYKNIINPRIIKK